MSNLVHGTNLVYVADLVYGANLVHAANMVDAPYMIHAANLVHEAEKQQNDPALNKLEGMDLHPRTFFWLPHIHLGRHSRHMHKS